MNMSYLGKNRFIGAVGFIALTILLTACPAATTTPAPSNPTLSITPAVFTTNVGSTTDQVFQLAFSDDSSVSAATWSLSVSDKGSISPTTGGTTIYTPPPTGSTGSVVLTATVGDESKTAIITITAGSTNPTPDPTLTVNPSATSVNVGSAAITISANLTNSTETINWTHSGAGSITSNTGTTTQYNPPASGGANSATVTATAAGKTATATITVNPAGTPVVTLGVSPTSQTVTVNGGSTTFTATTNSSDTVTWTLSGAGAISPTTGSTTSYTPPSSGANSTATLTASVEGESVSATITINAATLEPPTTGLIAEFLSFENHANRILPDTSGSNNDGYTNSSGGANISTGPDPRGVSNKGFDFKGSEQPSVIEVRSSPTGTGNIAYGDDLSFALWVADFTNNTGFLIGPKATGSASSSAGLVVENRVVSFDIPLANGAAGQKITDPTPIETGSSAEPKWTFYVATMDRTGSTASIKLYRNGVQVSEGTVTSATTSIPTTSTILIGNKNPFDANAANNDYRGYLDNIRVYNRALDASEVQTLANELPEPIEGSLGISNMVAEFLNFEAFSNRILPDNSGNGNDAYGNSSGSINIEATTDHRGLVDQAFNFRRGDPGRPSLLEIRSSPTGAGTVSLGDNYSFSVWVGQDQVNRQGFIMGPKASTTSRSPGLINNTSVSFEIPDAEGGTINITDPSPLPRGTATKTAWTFYAATIAIDSSDDSAVIRLYRDGVFVDGNSVLNASTALPSSSIIVGARGTYTVGSAGSDFEGRLDNMRVFNKVLSDSDITTLFNELTPLE